MGFAALVRFSRVVSIFAIQVGPFNVEYGIIIEFGR